MIIISDFETKTKSKPQKEVVIVNCGNEVPMYTIETINDLVQYVGYAKYKNCKTHSIFLRGQTDYYSGSMVPSLYRGQNKPQVTAAKFGRMINELLEIRSFANFPKPVLVATLQHYGIRTPQIDVVDNLWVALWFASNQFHGSLVKSTEHIVVTPSTFEYGYIYLLASDAIHENSLGIRGLNSGVETSLIDLRSALPSYFLRPHAQHAYMLKKNEIESKDYSDLIVGIAKIPVPLIEKWIGNSELLSVHSLFPSAYYDSGYEILLKHYPDYGPDYARYRGSIQVIT